MSPNPLRVALIGTGKIAEVGHLPGFVQTGAEIAALCDINTKNLNRLAVVHGVTRRYDNWQNMLDDGGFDIVSVCTPPVLHRDMVVASLEQGFHTLVEKPMAVTVDECQAMIDAADQNGKLLMVAHNQRFRTQHRIAKEILDEGRLGHVRRVHTVFAHGGPENWSATGQWYFDPKLAGYGVLLDLGYHKIDLLRWLLGQEITQIHAFAATFEKPTSADDTVTAIMKFEQGTLGTLQVSWAHHPGVPDSVILSCEHGMLKIPSNPSEPVRIAEQRPDATIVEAMYKVRGDAGPGWAELIRAFVHAVQAGEPSPLPGTEGKATLETILKMYASMDA